MPRTKGTRIGNGAGKGIGWGGPPKGAGVGPAKPYGPENPGMTPTEAREARGGAPSKHATRKAIEQQRAETLRDHLYTLATTAERQETQLSAAVAFLNRVEGLPVARQLIAGDPDGGPLQTSLTVSFVKPSESSSA